MTSGECKDEVLDSDWDYLLSGNPDDLLICGPPTEGEEGSDKLDDGGTVSYPFLINNTQPSGVESHMLLGDANQSPHVFVSVTSDTDLNGEMHEKAQGGDTSNMIHKVW